MPDFYRMRPEEHKGGGCWRLCVEKAEGDLTFVAEQKCTSHRPRASVLNQVRIFLTDEEVDWLHAALGEFIASRTEIREGCGLAGCSVPGAHVHCPECGGTDHVASQCPMEG